MKRMKKSYILIGTCIITLMLISCFIGVRWGKNLATNSQETMETESETESQEIAETEYPEEGTENVEKEDYQAAIEKFKEEMYITEDSILEIYHVPRNEAIFVNVIHDYVLREKLYFISKQGDEWCCEEFFVEGYGIDDIVEIQFLFRNEKTFVELAYSTGKGNGDIAVYCIEDGQLTLLLNAMGTVDRNLDTATNAVYEDGKLNMYLHINEQNPDFPDVYFWGTEMVYGYEEKDDYSGRELVYQMYDIVQLYQYDESEGNYIKMTEERDLVQQVEGVYPMWQ